jgi:organic hydroperoxide reductase OsmC/OhrA
MLKAKPRVFTFETSLELDGGEKGKISGEEGPQIEVASPPEFKGPGRTWTPEELFLASVNSCIMTTFLYHGLRLGVHSFRYWSKAVGKVSATDGLNGGLQFKEIHVYPRIAVYDENILTKARNAIQLASESCLISRSVKTEIKVDWEVGVD